MITNPAIFDEVRTGKPHTFAAKEQVRACRLTNENKYEVLEFLARRPLHTAVMSGFIRDNGIASPLNRGSFYACRGASGRLAGVALMGHAIFIESRCDQALTEFARLARKAGSVHMIMGEAEMVERFWTAYSAGGQQLRHSSRESLYVLSKTPSRFEPVSGLRAANLKELSAIVQIHAALAMAESGVNPLDHDAAGFSMRCRRRIEQGRVWVWIENKEIIFKADIISDTPQVCYLEGVYVAPRKRRQGYGARCLAQLCGHLLRRSGSVSLLVNERRDSARRFFERVGFVSSTTFETMFLQERRSQ